VHPEPSQMLMSTSWSRRYPIASTRMLRAAKCMAVAPLCQRRSIQTDNSDELHEQEGTCAKSWGCLPSPCVGARATFFEDASVPDLSCQVPPPPLQQDARSTAARLRKQPHGALVRTWARHRRPVPDQSGKRQSGRKIPSRS